MRKRLLISSILIVGILIQSCQQDESPTLIQKENVFEPVAQATTLEKSPEIIDLLAPISNQSLNGRSSSSTTGFGELNFDRIMEILASEDQPDFNYTIALTPPDSVLGTLEWLVLAARKDGYYGYIVQYLPSSNSTDLSPKSYSGYFNVLDLDRSYISQNQYVDGLMIEDKNGSKSALRTSLSIADDDCYVNCDCRWETEIEKTSTYQYGDNYGRPSNTTFTATNTGNIHCNCDEVPCGQNGGTTSGTVEGTDIGTPIGPLTGGTDGTTETTGGTGGAGGSSGSGGDDSGSTPEPEPTEPEDEGDIILLDPESFEEFDCMRNGGVYVDGNCLSEADAWEDRIDDSELKPCMQTIMTDLKNLTEGVGEIIALFAGDSEKYNWEVKDGLLSSNENAITSINFNSTTNTVSTTFDASKFLAATELSIARTILHESIHALVVATQFNGASFSEKQILFGSNWLQAYKQTGHDFMANNMHNKIMMALKEYGTDKGYALSNQFYSDLAWGGLTHGIDSSGSSVESSWFKTLVPNSSDRLRIINVISVEQSGMNTNGTSKTQEGTNAGC